jgi:cell division protein FtsI/penicillin-binding protein 2
MKNMISNKRIVVVMAIFSVLFFFVIIRLFWIQIVKNSYWKKAAIEQYQRGSVIKGKRGKILAATGEEIAYDIEVYEVIIDPVGIDEKKIEKVATILAKNCILKDDSEYEKKVLEKKIELNNSIIKGKKKNSQYYKVADEIFVDSKIAIFEELKANKAKATGLYFNKKYRRIYPQNKKFENIVGYLNIDFEGVYGIEKRFNDYLQGKEGYEKRYVSTFKVFELPVGEKKKYIEPENGKNIVLTIDYYMQHVLSSELEKMMQEVKAKSGAAIIVECDTGKIKAMVSLPISDNKKTLRNYVFQDQYEPGSIMKPVVVAMGLNEGLIKKNEIFISTGSIKVRDRVLREHDSTSAGRMTLTEVIAKSSNVAMVLIAQRFTHEHFYNAILKFGFGEKTEIDIHGENRTKIRNYKKWDGITMATMSYGQGMAVSQLQMIFALNTVVNGGVLLKPLIVERIEDEEGNIVQQYEKVEKRRVISEEISKEVTNMLRETVLNGTGTAAKIEGYDIGGKTGTAKKSFGKLGYVSGKYTSSFVGIYPVNKPKYICLVTIDEPQGKVYGGQIGGPVFRETFKKIFMHNDIRPEKDSGDYIYISNEKSKKSIKTNEEEKMKKESKKIEEKIEIKEVEKNEEKMPDLKGMGIPEVMQVLKKYRVDLKTEGMGKVVKQEPNPGSILKGVKEVKIKLEEKKSDK